MNCLNFSIWNVCSYFSGIFTFVWNEKLGTILHWDCFSLNISSIPLRPSLQCSGLQAEGCWAFNLSNIQAFHFTSLNYFSKLFEIFLFEIFLLICVKYFLQEQEVVSEALWIGGLAWSPPFGLSTKLQTSLILNPEIQNTKNTKY